eukprot:COSAG01_NODE_42729_length_437_cov_0.769231_1_plen_72_part_10
MVKIGDDPERCAKSGKIQDTLDDKETYETKSQMTIRIKLDKLIPYELQFQAGKRTQCNAQLRIHKYQHVIIE